MEKRQRGRPRKERDRIDPWRFTRASLAVCAYDEARGRGEKHSVAITEAVDFVKRRRPEMKISKTEVKRVLASLRPRNAGICPARRTVGSNRTGNPEMAVDTRAFRCAGA